MKRFVNIIKIAISERVQKYINYINFRYAVNKTPLRIIIGASKISQKGWVMSEESYLNLLKEENWKRYFSRNSIDTLLAEHVWEHLTKKEAKLATKICYKYLRKGGYLRVAVPDGMFPDKHYIDNVKPGGIGPGATDHKVLYTYKSLSKVFRNAGFKVILLEYFDEKKHFHYKNWSKKDGFIFRSKRFDERNIKGKFGYTSIVLDAIK